MTARTKWTPIILHQKAILIHIRFASKQKDYKSSLCSSRSFIRALAQKKNVGTALSTSAREHRASLQWGRIFWGDTSAAINFQRIWSWHFQLPACGACESWGSAGPTPGSLQYHRREICVLMPPSKYRSFFFASVSGFSLCCSQIEVSFSFLSSFSFSVLLLSTKPLVTIVAPSVSMGSCQASWATDWKRS